MSSLQILRTKNWRFHADISKLVSLLKNEFKARHWIMSDWEGNSYPMGEKKYTDPYVFSGREAVALFSDNFQMIWGVLSGSTETWGPEVDFSTAHSNEDIFRPFYQIQNLRSDLEIVAIDSSYTLVSARNEDILTSLRSRLGEETAYFTDCLKPIDAYLGGMTVNERLWHIGLSDDFYEQIKKKKYDKASSILQDVGLSRSDIDQIVESKKNA